MKILQVHESTDYIRHDSLKNIPGEKNAENWSYFILVYFIKENANRTGRLFLLNCNSDNVTVDLILLLT